MRNDIETKISNLSLLSSKQAADLLGVQEHTLAVWRCNKRYPLSYVKVGRYIKYRVADLQAFIEIRTVSA